MTVHECGKECEKHREQEIRNAYDDIERQFWKGHPDEVLIDTSELDELHKDAQKWRSFQARMDAIGQKASELGRLEELEAKAKRLNEYERACSSLKSATLCRAEDATPEYRKKHGLPDSGLCVSETVAVLTPDEVREHLTRLSQIEARARKELATATLVRSTSPQGAKLAAELICDIMGWPEPEWVKTK